MLRYIIACVLFFSLYSSAGLATTYTLLIQPVLPKAGILKAYQPLAEYLSNGSGQSIKIKAYNNFLGYWSAIRQVKDFDLVLDAAHFTDYRVQKKNYKVLAKLPDTVSFSIVTHEDNLIFDTDELVLKKVATMVSPAVGAIRLQNLFPDPIRQPKIVYAKNAEDAAKKVLNKKVFAAVIPTAMVSKYDALNTVYTTQALPHMALSASPEVPDEITTKIRQLLIDAKDTEKGREMLSKLNFTAFEPTDANTYKGYASLLNSVFGFK